MKRHRRFRRAAWLAALGFAALTASGALAAPNFADREGPATVATQAVQPSFGDREGPAATPAAQPSFSDREGPSAASIGATSVPSQLLRGNPDVPFGTPSVSGSHDGFNWTDGLIGAGFGALALSTLGLGIVVRRRSSDGRIAHT